MIDNIIVGRTISALRQSRGLTQQQLAAALSVSHQAVSKWENGAALPDIQTMVELTRFFGITVEQLISGEIPENKVESRQKTLDDHIQNIGNFVNSVVDGIFKPSKHSFEDAEYEEASEAPVEKPEYEFEANRASAQTDEKEETADRSFDINKLLQMAPYMSKQMVDELLLENRDKLSAGDIARFAPYISRECLETLINASEGEINWETLQKIAPFLKKEMVDGLAKAAAKGERFMKRALDQSCKATEDFEKTIEDVSRKISRKVDRVMRKAAKFGEEVVEGVSAAFEDLSENGNNRQSRASVLRNAAFERALQDNRWDWISGHLPELSDEDVRVKIAAKAESLGMNDWLIEFMPEYTSKNSIETAISANNWDWLAEHLWKLDPEDQDRILNTAMDGGYWQWIYENGFEIAGSDGGAKLAGCAYEAGEKDLCIRILETCADETIRESILDRAIEAEDIKFLKNVSNLDKALTGRICLAWAQTGKWANAAELAFSADQSSIEKMMELAIAEGNFDMIDVLNEYLD